jgi:hypothetical protein
MLSEKYDIQYSVASINKLFKISANQERDTKILFSDWLYQFLQENMKCI